MKLDDNNYSLSTPQKLKKFHLPQKLKSSNYYKIGFKGYVVPIFICKYESVTFLLTEKYHANAFESKKLYVFSHRQTLKHAFACFFVKRNTEFLSFKSICMVFCKRKHRTSSFQLHLSVFSGGENKEFPAFESICMLIFSTRKHRTSCFQLHLSVFYGRENIKLLAFKLHLRVFSGRENIELLAFKSICIFFSVRGNIELLNSKAFTWNYFL